MKWSSKCCCLGRIESGAMKSNPQPVDVAALCREIVEEVQIATQRRCEIEIHFADGDSRARCGS